MRDMKRGEGKTNERTNEGEKEKEKGMLTRFSPPPSIEQRRG